MRRFTRSFRTRSNIPDTNALRDQFIRQLTKEAERVLKQLSEEFGQSLQSQLSESVSGASGGSTSDGLGSISKLISTGARYLISRPKTSYATVESSRSIDANTSFKLSQSQAAAEAQAMLGRGDKNA